MNFIISELDIAISSITGHFDQPSYQMYRNLAEEVGHASIIVIGHVTLIEFQV